jgi:hypothetical protein
MEFSVMPSKEDATKNWQKKMCLKRRAIWP